MQSNSIWKLCTQRLLLLSVKSKEAVCKSAVRKKSTDIAERDSTPMMMMPWASAHDSSATTGTFGT